MACRLRSRGGVPLEPFPTRRPFPGRTMADRSGKNAMKFRGKHRTPWSHEFSLRTVSTVSTSPAGNVPYLEQCAPKSRPSCEGGNPVGLALRGWITAFAGMTREWLGMTLDNEGMLVSASRQNAPKQNAKNKMGVGIAAGPHCRRCWHSELPRA